MSVENFEHNFNVSKSFHITDAYDGFWGLALGESLHCTKYTMDV
jgi:hypothetical protein